MFTEIRNLYRNLKLEKSEIYYLLIILIIFFIYNLYKIFYYPVYIDEAITYNDYTSQGFVASATKYNEPNNHVFFSLISNIFYYLPFNAKINLRIPNLMFGAASSLAVYFIIRDMFNHKTAVLPHSVFTFSYLANFYSVFARGYMLIICITCLCFFCIYKMMMNQKKKYLFLFSFFSVLGFYTIPIFLYVSASFALYILVVFYKHKKILMQIFINYLIIAFCVIILYSPIIYNNGLDSIINNPYTREIPLHKVIDYIINKFSGFYNILTGIRSDFIVFPFLLFLILITIMSKFELYKKIGLFVVLFFLLPFIFMIIQRVIPGPRIWCYLLVPFVMGQAMIINFILKKIEIKLAYLYGLCVIIFIFQIFIFQKSHPYSAKPGDYIYDEIATMVRQRNYHSFYFQTGESEYAKEIIEYNYKSRNESYYFENGFDKGITSVKDSMSLWHFDCLLFYGDFTDYKKLISSKNKMIYNKNSLVIYGK